MIKPMHNYVLTTPAIEEPEKVNGLYRPGNATEGPVIRARVLSVGPGAFTDSGVRIPMTVNVGDVVLFQRRRSQQQEVNGEDVLLVPESDILAIEVP